MKLFNPFKGFDAVKNRFTYKGVEYKRVKRFGSEEDANRHIDSIKKGCSKRFPPIVDFVPYRPKGKKGLFWVCIPVLNGGR